MLRTRRMLPALAAGCVAIAAGGALALDNEAWMSGEEITSALGSKSINGHYRSGRTFSESYLADGRLDYRDDTRRSGGHWSIVNGAFCTIYDQDPTGGCYRVRRSGANCFEFYFVARTEEEAVTPRKPDWTARGWLNDRKDTCLDGANA